MRTNDADRCLHDFRPGECATCLGHDITLEALDFTWHTAPADSRVVDLDKPPVLRTRDLPATTRRRVAATVRGRTYPALCVNDHCRKDRPPRPTGGRSNLCPVCEDRARDNLAVIARHWGDLEAALHAHPELRNEKVKASPSLGINLDVTILEAVLNIDTQVTWLASLVRDERGIAWPYDTVTVALVAAWLEKGHVPWLAGHEDAGISEALAVETTSARKIIEHAIFPRERKRIELPLRCLHDVPVDVDDPDGPTRRCGQLLHTVCIVGIDTLPDFHCPAGHVTEPASWATAGWRRRAFIPEVAERVGDLNTVGVHTLMRRITSTTYTTSRSEQ